MNEPNDLTPDERSSLEDGKMSYAELIVPYLDGELEPERARELEVYLESSAEARSLLEQHRLVSDLILQGSLAADGSPLTAAPSATATLEAVHLRLRRSRWKRLAGLVSAAAALVLITVLFGPWGAGSDQDGIVEEIKPADPAVPKSVEATSLPDEALLEDLEILEVLESEAGELTPELVELLLESDVGNLLDSGVLDPRVFDYLLEEEISGKSL